MLINFLGQPVRLVVTHSRMITHPIIPAATPPDDADIMSAVVAMENSCGL